MKYLFLTLTLLLLLQPGRAKADIEEISRLREDVEILATETEELKATLKQEEAIYSGKYQDLKNQILREKLKRIQLEQQIAQYQTKRKAQRSQPGDLNLKQAQELQQNFLRRIQPLEKRVSSTTAWKQDLQKLEDLLREGQLNLYQIKLIQFMERRLQESTQVRKSFQTLPHAAGKTFEVLNLGYLISFAKNQDSAYVFSADKGWLALTTDSQREALERIFADHKKRSLQFIPLSPFPQLEENKDKSYVRR
ncbi:MAG: hypothetical protein OM95_11835 [Bdellovibrio sp. ArHS]|uniref:hypothetical protein n=1 Tax=Bdellovibrio sp. ArHS TaxID=1569284 RepID=UPI0005825AAC|nr:hypothetical protein [Bdellovibrio sp. ArHS]KHD87948.1 MAG: hypothetical protein OM95_11835 [Bdellovibrio sp. ArHS]